MGQVHVYVQEHATYLHKGHLGGDPSGRTVIFFNMCLVVGLQCCILTSCDSSTKAVGQKPVVFINISIEVSGVAAGVHEWSEATLKVWLKLGS